MFQRLREPKGKIEVIQNHNHQKLHTPLGAEVQGSGSQTPASSESPERLVQIQLAGPHHRVFDPLCREWDLRMCISHQHFPGEAHAAGSRTTFENLGTSGKSWELSVPRSSEEGPQLEGSFISGSQRKDLIEAGSLDSDSQKKELSSRFWCLQGGGSGSARRSSRPEQLPLPR